MRLSTMIVLFAVVVLLMLVANRPEIWSRFVPNWDESTPVKVNEKPQRADSSSTIDQTSPQATPRRSPLQQSPLLMGALLVVALMYFVWRLARIGRAVSRRVESIRDERNKAAATWAIRSRRPNVESIQSTSNRPHPAAETGQNEADHLDTTDTNPKPAGGQVRAERSP
jgi:hypothetical protein